MVVLVPCKDILEYEKRLSSFISQNVSSSKRITFIDCLESIHPYLFEKKELDCIVDHLFITHVHRLDDFIEQIERLCHDPYFLQSDVVLVSSYLHFISDLSVSEQQQFVRAVTRMLVDLECEYGVSVVFMDINSKWGLLFGDVAVGG